MKKIFALIAAAVVAASMISCEIADPYISPLGSEELKDYAGKLLSNSALLPVEMVDMAIDLDEYLVLPEEEKQKDKRFYGRLSVLGDNIYKVSYSGFSCIVDTGGRSVWENGAQWKFTEFVTWVYATGFGEGGWRTSITEDVTVTFTSDTVGEALLMVRVQMPASEALMALKSREEGLNTWNMAVRGVDTGNDGLRAEYSSGEGTGDLKVTRRWAVDKENPVEKVMEKVCEGMFFVDIYNGSQKIDWVKLTLKPGYSSEYETSR